MNAVRLVSYVLDPFSGERHPVAALLVDAQGVSVVRAPAPYVPDVARANVERVLLDLEASPDFDLLPLGVGAQVVAGMPLAVPAAVMDVPAWVRDVLLTRAA